MGDEVRRVESADRGAFEEELRGQLEAMAEEPTVDPESIQVTLTVGPGPHFAALVTCHLTFAQKQGGSKLGK
jgi:hypothetical protein